MGGGADMPGAPILRGVPIWGKAEESMAGDMLEPEPNLRRMLQ